MKTAISVPDETFARVERMAQRLGMNRSQFFTAAAAGHLDALESTDVTEAIDAALTAAARDESTSDAALAGRRFLAAGDEEW